MKQAIVFIGISFSLAYSAQAQEPDLFELSLEELIQVKVIGSSLAPESLRVSPASVTVFTAADIAKLGVNTLEELCAHAPGFQSYLSDRGLPTLSARARNGNRSNEVLLILDGQRLNDSYSGALNFTTGFTSLEQIERVEFIRGPGSAVYGANAFLGTINLITKTHNQVKASLGTAGTRALVASGTLTSADLPIGVSLLLQTRRRDGEQQTDFDPLAGQYRASTQSTEHNEAYVRAHLGDLKLDLRHSSNNLAGGYVVGSLNDRFNRLEVSADFAATSYQHTLNDHWRLTTRASRAKNRFSPVSEVALKPQLTILHSTVTTQENAANANLLGELANSTLSLGVEYMDSKVVESQGYYEFPATQSQRQTSNPDPDKRNTLGVYSEWQCHITAQVSCIVGLRSDHDSQFGNRISPRSGLVWQLNAENTLKVLYGEAFRAPTRLETSAIGFVTQGNPKLLPEVAKTAEIIWVHSDERRYFATSLYNTQIDDVVQDTLGQTNGFINGAAQHQRGVELEGRWQLNPQWQWQAVLSHQYEQAITHNANAATLIQQSYIFTQARWLGSITWQFVGPSEDVNTSTKGYKTLDSYQLVNANVEYHWQDVRLYVRAHNLLGKDYRVPAVVLQANTEGVVGAGRRVEMGVSVVF